MGGYTKNIAVIKGLKEGFSADGGALTGLVKAERYGGNLKIEVTFINFAPLSEGRYVTAVSDGNNTLIVEDGFFEGASALETGSGFAALVCYINGGVYPVASAVSGNFHGAALTIKAEVERAENIKNGLYGGTAVAGEAGENNTASVADVGAQTGYNDEAIAEVNYYDFAETYENGGAVRAGAQEEKNGSEPQQNEAASGACQARQSGVDPDISRGEASFAANNGEGNGGNVSGGPLAGGNFYKRMKAEIEGLLSAYPAAEDLQSVVQGSKWVKISYGDGKFYVFGVIYDGAKPLYICYGVPSENTANPPESMQGLATFIPSSAESAESGYWVMYQDANTGASLKISLI